jgi:thiamine-monophosphate kinase
VAAGLALAPHVRAAVDVSDGLVQDLGHVCRASGVGARIGIADLPLSPAYRRAARRLRDPWTPALAGGEDYELALAIPPALLPRARAAAARARTPLAVVGRFVRGAGVLVVGPRGEPLPPPPGHDHLRGAPPAVARFRSSRRSSRIR